MSTERWNYIFQQYPETVTMSNARKAKYIGPTDKLNKTQAKQLQEERLEYRPRKVGKRNDICLWNKEKEEWVLKNPMAAGTPKIMPINGQNIWRAGGGSEWYVRKVKDTLRAYFVPALIRQNIELNHIAVPNGWWIHFEFIFYVPVENRNGLNVLQDWFNHSTLYMKAFEDVLQEEGWLETDSPAMVRGGYARYVDIPTAEDRRLEVKVHLCRNSQRLS